MKNIKGLFGVLVGTLLGRLSMLIFPNLNWFLGILMLFVVLFTFVILINKYFDIKIKIQFLEKKLHPALWWGIFILIFCGENVLFDKILS